MNRAQRRAAVLRRDLGLHGSVDAEAVAGRLGLEVRSWPFEGQRQISGRTPKAKLGLPS